MRRKMKKIGLSEAVIRHKMMHNGFDANDINRLLIMIFSKEENCSIAATSTIDLEPYRCAS
jgi:hypothetical protein